MSDTNLDQLIEKVNIEFKKVVDYFRFLKLALHPEKTKFILFTKSTEARQKNVYINNSRDHREITIIELQSLVVFGCTALLLIVGATASTHDREEGWDNFLFVYTE